MSADNQKSISNDLSNQTLEKPSNQSRKRKKILDLMTFSTFIKRSILVSLQKGLGGHTSVSIVSMHA